MYQFYMGEGEFPPPTPYPIGVFLHAADDDEVDIIFLPGYDKAQAELKWQAERHGI